MGNAMHVEDLLHRHLMEQTTVDEERELAAWRAQSRANEDAFQHAVESWHSLDCEDAFDVDKGWQRLEPLLQEATVVVPIRRRGMQMYALAAALLVATMVWLLIPEPAPIAFTGTAGHQRLVSLPDGSTVWLYGTSSLRHDAHFGARNRVIALSGQAFFEVVPNGHPFVVTTSEAEIRVMGTAFDVREGLEETRVVVREGSVRVDDGTHQVTLGPDQMTIAGPAQALSARTVDGQAYLDWLEGELHFEGTRLSDVLLDLERHFGVPLELGAADLEERTLTAAFPDTDLKNVLDEICLALNLSYEERGDGYQLIAK
jgi:ferric-dicitrate binding protein FerR (iron transport regulator)